MAPHEEDTYHPKDAVRAAITGSMITGGAGLSVAAVQNTLSKKNLKWTGVFTRGGGTIATFTAMGGVYEFTRLASANLRERDDSWNNAIGGFLAGNIMGLRAGTTPAVLGFGAMFAVVMGVYDYTGGKLTGYDKDPNVDEFERKQALRKNKRIPIEQTIAEIGEGRGIYGPGYDERRRERIKEKYGLDVPAKS